MWTKGKDPFIENEYHCRVGAYAKLDDEGTIIPVMICSTPILNPDDDQLYVVVIPSVVSKKWSFPPKQIVVLIDDLVEIR